MSAQPLLSKFFGQAIGNTRNRNAGCVRADDCVACPKGFDLSHQRLFGIESFDDGFDNPVILFQLRKVDVEATQGD